MPEYRLKRLYNGVFNPFGGRVGFDAQFWGEYTYAIQSDTIPTENVYLQLDKTDATKIHVRMRLSRNYDTFCPAQCGIDPNSSNYNPQLYYGGSHSIENWVRDSSFRRSQLIGIDEGFFFYYLGGTNSQTPFGEIIAFKSSNDYASGYTTGDPILWNISSIVTGYAYAPDLEIYLVYSNSDNCYYWCIRSAINNYYEYFLATDGMYVYSEDTDEGEEDDEVIGIPNLPPLGVENVGVKIYKADDYTNLLQYMWGTDELINRIRKLVGDETPYECIVAFNVMPYGEAFTDGVKEDIIIGNVNTGLEAPRTGQYAALDFGTVKIERKFNNALDFAPYTAVELFLPFIGRVKLPTDFVMDKTLGVVYHMDCVTGGCFAYITVDDVGVIQCEGGSCLIQLPITAQTANGARQAISSAMAAGASFASAGSVASTITLPKSGVKVKTFGEGATSGGDYLSGVNQAWNALSAKDSYSTFGGLSLANGFLGLNNPVVYIHRPINATPAGYNSIIGYPSSEIATLGNLTGFTQVKAINLGIAGASEEDLAEIEALLKEGVVL